MHYVNKRSEYSWILGFTAAIDLVYAVVTGFLMPSHLITSEHYYLQLNNSFIQYLPTYQIEALIILSMFVLCIVTPSNTVHFWYRSKIICDGNVWSKQRYCMIYLGFVGYCIVQSGILYSNTNHESDTSVEDILNSTGLAYDRTYVARHAVYELKSPRFIFGALCNQLSQTIQYGMLFHFGWKIVKRMRTSTHMSTKSKKTQEYVVKVMILQAMYPLILMVLPLVASSVCIFMEMPFSSEYIVSEFVVLMPILSSLTVLTLIPSYRMCICNTIHKASITASGQSF
ncbi:unnamed protein product [Bursaphelenchus okinawaensis]|uniref:Seven TM Receptor n=1 Tax=Bursaphelenchus okinawaensis TaxID=465554 RepID=A0A811KPD0_9BILA|nr:unnamed protein product [Bursaphelenchus okinawaensis]CAG9107265.1 unnamed protein product [Bursaphelenchus okinawaensis]